MSSVRDLAIEVLNLVHYGGFTRDDVLNMPAFERHFLHEKTLEIVERDIEFQLALHDKKQR